MSSVLVTQTAARKPIIKASIYITIRTAATSRETICTREYWTFRSYVPD
jgi:hypothetical protein